MSLNPLTGPKDLSVQQRSEPPGGILLHRWQCVRVDTQRDFDPLVTKSALDNLRWDAGLQHQRCARVPQAVNGHWTNFRGFNHRGELSLTKVL